MQEGAGSHKGSAGCAGKIGTEKPCGDSGTGGLTSSTKRVPENNAALTVLPE